MFVDNQPEIFPNEIQFELVSPQEIKKEVVDPKAKNAKAAEVKESNFTEEEEALYGPRKIFLEYKPEAEEQPEIAFNLKILYQGAEYEDPNPPKEEEVVKKPPQTKGKKEEVIPDKPVIRMIKPEPLLMA